MTDGPITITTSADGSLGLWDELGRLVAIVPAPGQDQRPGSPQRADQALGNARLFAAAGALEATVQGLRGMAQTEVTRGSSAWRKALVIMDTALDLAAGRGLPAPEKRR